MGNLTMDLTGQNTAYAESNRVFRIFKYNQLVDFECTVFKDSVRVYLVSGGISTYQLTLGQDYLIPDTYVGACDNDASRAKLLDGSFDKQLICGIQMIRGVGDGTYYTIAVSYQRLYPNQTRTAYYHNEPLNVTPELLYDVVKSVEELKILTSRVTDVSDLTTHNSLLLELDESKTNENNHVTGEKHLLNVPNGHFVITPNGGSFYRDSVKVTHNGSLLVEGTDYYIAGMDEAATKATSYTSPVYKFLVFVTSITDEVELEYWAYGGVPTLDNYQDLVTNLNNVITYLNAAKTLTEDTVGSTEVMTSLYERVDTLEDQVRRLLGTPSYGNVTYGKSIVMKLFSDTPGIHWFTIAQLYKADSAINTVAMADTFIFRLQSLLTHFQFEAAVSVDLENTTGDKFNVNVLSDNYPRGFTPFEDYGEISKIIRPQLRVVWNTADKATGAYLQLGFEFKGILEETIQIEDMSGHESSWTLVDESASATNAQDDDFTLPDGTSIWSTATSESQVDSQLIPFSNGQLIWAGSQSLNRPAEGWQSFTITQDDTLLLDTDVNIKKFRKLRLDIEEVEGLQFPIDIEFNSGLSYLKGHATFTHQNKPVYVNAEIYKDNSVLTVRLNYDVTAGIESNELCLRDLVIY